jgi:hypothetical protein
MSPTTGIKFSPNPWHRVKAILLLPNVDLKDHSFYTVEWKNFEKVSSSYLRAKASPYKLF